MGALADSVKGRSTGLAYESLLYPEVRLFTRVDPWDSLSVGYRFVESPRRLMECFQYFSRGKCFTSLPAKPAPSTKSQQRGRQKGAKKKAADFSLATFLPGWFSPKSGATLHQWISAFLESVLLSRFVATQCETPTPLGEVLEPYREALAKGRQLVEFWKKECSAEEKLKVAQSLQAKQNRC